MHGLKACAALILCCTCAAAQTRLTLEQAASRTPPDYRPAHEGQDVIVRGQVSAARVRFAEVSHVGLQDDAGHGLVLEAPDFMFEKVSPGDRIEARGVIAMRDGLPVLRPSGITTFIGAAPPPPHKVSPADLNSLRYLGLTVSTEARITALGENASGEYLLLGQPERPVKVFLSRESRGPGAGLSRFTVGDRVRVVGLVCQEATDPPYDRMFRLVIGNVSAITLLERDWLIPPQTVLTVLLIVAFSLGIWYRRERLIRAQTKSIRLLNALSEEIIDIPSAEEIVHKLESLLTDAIGMTGVRMYVYDRGGRTLELVPAIAAGPVVFAVEGPKDPMESVVSLCFRNRTLLSIPDTKKSPFFRATPNGETIERALIFVPMVNQNEPVGVLVLSHPQKVRTLRREQQAALHHLGNQAATALRLLEQQSVREQLFRSEKLAAAGQLISGIATELKAPLATIAQLTNTLRNDCDGSEQTSLRAIATESRRATEILFRMISFARADQSEAAPVDLNALLRELVECRREEWDSFGIRGRQTLSSAPLFVLGSQAQLEQVFLSLLLHAEHAVEQSPDKVLVISTSLLSKRALIEISYAAAPDAFEEDPFADSVLEGGALGLSVCRGVIRSHGGEIRLTRASDSLLRFEVEMQVTHQPGAVHQNGNGEVRKATRPLTVLLLEPDDAVERRLLGQLTARGHRVVPAATGEEGLDLAVRMRFDVALCSIRLPGLNWVEFFERSRSFLPSCVLMTEGYDSDLARVLPGGEGHVLRKPIDEGELDKLLASIESRVELAAPQRR
jgi:signal transduction histidine kinase/CheY-like chemotaxis protein